VTAAGADSRPTTYLIRKLNLSTHTPEGITNPPIDELLTKVDSKYRLVLFAAKRARQINAYYSQLGEGLLENVGPLVDIGIQEKPLTIALREVNAGVLECTDIDPEAEAAARAEVVGDPDFSLDPFGVDDLA
jgi:DNA-directed RNA polymerase subunit omega